MPFCISCGAEISGGERACAKCRQASAILNNDDAALRIVLPVGRSGWAIAAGYLALFSVLCFPAPFALLTGILAVRDIKRNPEKHGLGRAWFGIIMGALFSLVLLLLVLGAVLSAVFG